MEKVSLRDRIRQRPEFPTDPLPDLESNWQIEELDLPFTPEPPPVSAPSVPFEATKEEKRQSIKAEKIDVEDDVPNPTPKKAKKSYQDLLQRLDINKRMLLIALGLAGFASLLTVSYINESANTLYNQSKLLKVVVAKQDIPLRTPLDASMFEVKEIPALYVPKNALDNPEGLVGKVALTALHAGEPMFIDRLSDPNSSTGLAMIIPDGHRALTISSGSAVLIKPSDYVDVIATLPNPKQYGQTMTIPALQRCMVLAVDEELGAMGDNRNAQTITIAVPDSKVNIMTMLEGKGSFKVVLRAPNDTSVQPDVMTDRQLQALLTGQDDRPKQSAAVLGPPIDTPPVRREVIRYPAYTPREVSQPRYNPPAKPKARTTKPKPQSSRESGTVTVINGTQVTQQNTHN